jgi:hypothetical protein
MLSGIPYIKVPNPTDRLNFLLHSLRLPFSKDLRKWMAKRFFYDWVLKSDHVFYTKFGVFDAGLSQCYEMLKTCKLYECKGRIFNDSGYFDLAYAYASCGKKVYVPYLSRTVEQRQTEDCKYVEIGNGLGMLVFKNGGIIFAGSVINNVLQVPFACDLYITRRDIFNYVDNACILKLK